MTETYWSASLKVGDKVIVTGTGYCDIPRVTTITRATRTQVFLKDGPCDHEYAFWKHTGWQVSKRSWPLSIAPCTEDAEQAVEHRQRQEAILGCVRNLEKQMKYELTPGQVRELHDCFLHVGLIEGSIETEADSSALPHNPD